MIAELEPYCTAHPFISKSLVLYRLSEAVDEKYCCELHARSGFRFIIRLQEDAWILPTSS